MIRDLELELKVLIERYGLARVRSALASFDPRGAPTARLNSRASGNANKKKRKPPLQLAYERIASAPNGAELKTLLTLYLEGKILPTIKSVTSFLQAHEIKSRPKSRQVAAPILVEAWRKCRGDEILALLNSASNADENGAYQRLADELMRRRPG